MDFFENEYSRNLLTALKINENCIILLDKESMKILNNTYNVELNYGREHQKLTDLISD